MKLEIYINVRGFYLVFKTSSDGIGPPTFTFSGHFPTYYEPNMRPWLVPFNLNLNIQVLSTRRQRGEVSTTVLVRFIKTLCS